VVGNLPEVSPGEFLRLQGQWNRHPTHGSQFKADVCEQTLPATIAGIQGYLGSGMIKGIGPKLAERIVGKFQEDTFNVIEQTRNAFSKSPVSAWTEPAGSPKPGRNKSRSRRSWCSCMDMV
jgi:exodeoxyribonuclease V alpha subunit